MPTQLFTSETAREAQAKATKRGPSHATIELRAMVFEALEMAGGAAYLHEQAHANPSAFLSLVSKFVPRDIKLSGPGLEAFLDGSWARDRQKQLTNGGES